MQPGVSLFDPMRRLGWLCLLLASLRIAAPCAAQTASLELTFTPIDRAQLALWVERDDGTFMGTLALTYAVAKAGIGNRPGALQMNSGYRWPYGRREGVLPVWAHRRAAAPGAAMFKRIIFQDRTSEGYGTQNSQDQSPDDFFCLSFTQATTTRDALDAVTCASTFFSDKGRYVTQRDLDVGYAEPFENAPGVGTMRRLDLWSLYPPRRNVERCAQGCFDHVDVADFRKHALAVMPELDAITRATLQGRRSARWNFDLPDDWPRDTGYKLFIEVNVEGDYSDSLNPTSFPVPSAPANKWDYWATNWGYPYRGQPSVVYELPFSLANPSTSSVLMPIGYGAQHGEHGDLLRMDQNISDDPARHPGSGADRLLALDGKRASLRVLTSDTPYCQRTQPPGGVEELSATPYPDKKWAHTWARLSFRAPQSERNIGAYVVEVKPAAADWEQAYTPDAEHDVMPVALDVCADPEQPGQNRCESMETGSLIEVTLANLRPATHYEVRVTPRDHECGELGAATSTELITRERTFSTVTPCFVASAAYGTPLAREIGVLRAARDRYLAPHAFGRALIAAYYTVGPTLAEPVREHPWLASVVRALLAPVVHATAWWMR
jgi:hypothetical protein